MPRTYKGKYTVKHPSKYKGNLEEVVYRSNWEKSVMIWLDNNSEVAKWNSEDFIIPYYYDVDKRWHKYHVDFWIKFKSGNVLLVEVKPKKQTQPPKSKNPRSKRSLNEAFAYMARPPISEPPLNPSMREIPEIAEISVRDGLLPINSAP